MTSNTIPPEFRIPELDEERIPADEGTRLQSDAGQHSPENIGIVRAPSAQVGHGYLTESRARKTGAALLLLAAVVLLVAVEYPDRGFVFATGDDGDRARSSQLVETSQVVALLRESYAFSDRLMPRKMLMASLMGMQEEVDVLSITPAVDLEKISDDTDLPSRIEIHYRGRSQTISIAKVENLFSMVWKLMEVFSALDLTEKQNEDLEDAAISGMLSVLDPHTVYMNEDEFKELKYSTRGQFGGLGIVISVKDGQLTVMSVMAGTPAHIKGVKKNDKIVQIGEESTINMTVSEAANKMRGEPGTDISIVIRRTDVSEPIRLTLTREVIKVNSVSAKALPGSVAYLHVKTFQEDSAEEVQSFLDLNYQVEPPSGIILDLRGDSGGVMSAAVELSDLFLPEGDVVTTLEKDQQVSQTETSDSGDRYEHTPLVVLVDHGSASASEIVTAALKFRDRAVVLGQRTFGKGSVQYMQELTRGALKLTVAQYVGPGFEVIQGVGIAPHVELRPVTNKRWLTVPSFIDTFQGEGGLPYHLERTDDAYLDAPLYYIRYVPDDPAGSETDLTSLDEAVVDRMAWLAWDVLMAGGRTSAAETFANAEDMFVRRELLEAEAIGRLAEDDGKQWVPAPLPAQAEVSVQAHVQPLPVNQNYESWLDVRVTNDGDAELPALYVRTDCTDLRWNAKTCLIGNLKPGESQSCGIRAKPADGSPSRRDLIFVDVLSGLDEYLASTTAVSEVKGETAPRVELSWWIDDSAGNGNGLPDEGETFDLVLDIRNFGGTPFKRGLAAVKNLSGAAIYLKKGREDLADIAPGSSVRATMQLSVASIPEGGYWRFEAGVVDVSGRRHFMAKGAVPVPQERALPARLSGNAAARSGPVRLLAFPASSAPAAAVLTSGTVPFVGVAGDYIRVYPAPDRPLWALRSEVTETRTSDQQPAVEWLSMAREPLITLESPGTNQLVASADSLTLKGAVDFGTGQELTDAGVIVYNDGVKVNMKYIGDLKPVKNSIAYEFTISLHPGANSIVIAAYSKDRSNSYYSIVINRPLKSDFDVSVGGGL